MMGELTKNLHHTACLSANCRTEGTSFADAINSLSSLRVVDPRKYIQSDSWPGYDRRSDVACSFVGKNAALGPPPGSIFSILIA